MARNGTSKGCSFRPYRSVQNAGVNSTSMVKISKRPMSMSRLRKSLPGIGQPCEIVDRSYCADPRSHVAKAGGGGPDGCLQSMPKVVITMDPKTKMVM